MMKPPNPLFSRSLLFGFVAFGINVAALAEHPSSSLMPLPAAVSPRWSDAIPFDQLGAKAQEQYSGDGISVTATPDGARLQAVFQRLEGLATSEGLWMISTEGKEDGTTDRFRVIATAIGRENGPLSNLPRLGVVRTDGQTSRFFRPGITEEYRVSMDGVRQDFIILERPAGDGKLQVQLAVSGATAEAATYGAKLMLTGSGRGIAYSRLHVADVTGRTLTARLEVLAQDRLAVVVDDASALYPVCIDPTFSDADWMSTGGYAGANDSVTALAVDGSGNLYVGGGFTALGNVLANHVAKWNGSTWSSLGSGTDGNVFTLTASGNELYVGGSFTTAGGISATNIAKWDGTNWSALGGGTDGGVSVLLVSGSSLYAAGRFSNAGGTLAKNIAMWNGSTWSPLGDGIINNQYDDFVSALALSGTNLYVGGSFMMAGNVAALSIAKWNGTAWSALGAGLGIWNSEPAVGNLAIVGNDLYAAGRFSTASGVAINNNVAKWNGTNWSTFGVGVIQAVSGLTVSNSVLYVAGRFHSGGSTTNYIATWNGSAWSQVTPATQRAVSDFALSGNTLYAVGNDNQSNEDYVAKWENAAWSSLAPGGLNGTVEAIAVSGTNLYIGGRFTSVPGTTANHVAKWDGSTWSPLGAGVSSTVRALAVVGTNVYAGGAFGTAGGIPVNRIAKWNGTTWSPLGSGTDDSVRVMTVIGADLYVGGFFQTAGGITVNSIAKWNGSAWSALGAGLSSGEHARVSALAASGTNLYVGGEFTMAGGVPANNIALWNGAAWSALGAGITDVGGDATVYALAVSGNDVYAGGYFTKAGTNDTKALAKWDGSTWSALGSGFVEEYPEVAAMAMRDGVLYVGGAFTNVGGITANGIAAWNGTGWSAGGNPLARLGSNPFVSVTAMAFLGTDLYVGGRFDIADGKISPYLAFAQLGSSGGPSVIFTNGQATISLQVPATGQYQIQRSTNLVINLWVTLGTVSDAGSGTISYTDTAPPLPNAYYRALYIGP